MTIFVTESKNFRRLNFFPPFALLCSLLWQFFFELHQLFRILRLLVLELPVLKQNEFGQRQF